MQIFITGTDTDAGKTYVTRLLLEALRAEGSTAAGAKPFCCGTREDSAILLASSLSGLTLDDINPIWLKTPASPMTAALIENRKLDSAQIIESCQALGARADHLLIEGAGGWEVPISPGYTMADFAADLKMPVLVVANNRLGALNHTLLTVKNILQRGLPCLGVVLNYVAAERDVASISNVMILRQMLDVPVLGEIMHGETNGQDLLDAVRESYLSMERGV
jgi:dethiobiotin synthetase